jgi:nucleoside-diphosphate-sugar epimerase
MPDDGRSTPAPADSNRFALVTGVTGFVGSRIARRLRDEGWRVRGLVRTHDPSPDLAGIEQVEGDFTDPATARVSARGPRIVIHCAATGSPERELAERINVAGTRSMIDAALGNACERYIQISTGSVYQVEGLPVVDEDSPLQERDAEPYGATKAEGDRAVLESARGGLAATIFRPGAILGVHPTSTWAVKVPERIRTDPAGTTRPRSRTMPWVHVEDLVDAVLLALASKTAIGRVYNMVDEHTTWGEYADRVRSWLGLPPQPEAEAGTPTPWKGHFDARGVRDDLGYAPRRTFAQGMEEAERFWRERLVATGSV